MLKTISYDNFLSHYRPVENHINTNAAYDGCMFETYGDEAAYIQACKPENVWTLIDEDGELFIINGFHFVNRLGYFVANRVHKNNDSIHVELEESGKKTKASQIKKLVIDFLDTTKRHIDAYDQEGADNKQLFHKHSKAILKCIAKDLGYKPDSYDLRSNMSGVAGSGEITLHTNDLYIQFGQGCGSGLEILYRTCKNRKDYTGGTNNWLPFEALKNYESALKMFNNIR